MGTLVVGTLRVVDGKFERISDRVGDGDSVKLVVPSDKPED
jgi:hypothetical protein